MTVVPGDVFTVTITFSEAVTGFVQSDISASNANLSGFTGSGAVYSVTVTATGTGGVQLLVPANVATANSGAGNLAASSAVASANTVAETQDKIATYLMTRANMILGNQQDLTTFLSSGTSENSLRLQFLPGSMNFNFSSRKDRNVWGRLRGSFAESAHGDFTQIFGEIGAHRVLNENLLLGALLQFDHTEQKDGVQKTSGTGVMVGPYIVGRAANQQLTYEARLLVGGSENEFSPFGTYTDTFSTRSLLARAKISGRLEFGSLVLEPLAAASFMREIQPNYVNGIGVTIPGQSLSVSRISTGVSGTSPIAALGENWSWRGAFLANYTSTDYSGPTLSSDLGFEGASAKVEFGIDYNDPATGSLFGANVFVDGIGAGDFSHYGASLTYSRRF